VNKPHLFGILEIKAQCDAWFSALYIYFYLFTKAFRHGTRSQGISQFYLHTPRSPANGTSHTCLCLPSRSWYSFTDVTASLNLPWLK